MSEFQTRLRNDLEPILASADPRQKISAYHDMPYALFRYDPEEEFDLRGELTLLKTRLEQKSKRVIRISLADCLFTALGSVSPLGDWFEAERAEGVDNVIQTISNVLESHTPLVDLVAHQMPADPDPKSDVVLINRTSAKAGERRCGRRGQDARRLRACAPQPPARGCPRPPSSRQGRAH